MAGAVDESRMALLGVSLNSNNLIHSKGLQVQLLQMLELMAEFSSQFKEIDRKIEKNDAKVREHTEQIKLAQEEISRVDTKVDMVDKALRADLKEVDDRHTKNIKGACDRITICEEQGHELKQEIENMKETVMPRLNKLEEESAATQATLVSHGERLTTSEGLVQETRTRLTSVEKFIEEADIAGLKIKLDETAEKVTVLDGRMEKMVLFLDKTNKKVIWVQEVLVPEVRKEAKDDRALIRSEVDEHVFILMGHVRNRVTRKEFEDEQNFFHRTMTTWVIEEIDTNRRSVLEKINTISARMAGELEELTGMGGVEECVAKVQEITSHVSSLSDSLWEHKLQIERNAEKLVELGANAAQVAEIKENFKELKKKTQSTLMMIRAKLESQRTNSAAPNDDPQKKALGELDSQLAGSLAIIRKELENDFAPKLTFEESVAVLKKRIIDLEYKFMKRKNDDSGLDRHNTQEMYREFNQKLASLNHPILLTQKHPAADKLPPRPRSAMPSGSSKSTPARPGSAQVRVVKEDEETVQVLPSVAVSYFESPEMRKALKEGRNVSVKGSSAATRLYRKNAEHGLQIPESIQALMSTSEDHPDDQFDHEFGDTSTPHYTYFQQDAEPIIITPSGHRAVMSTSVRPSSAVVSSTTDASQGSSHTASVRHGPTQKRHSRPETAPLKRTVDADTSQGASIPPVPQYMIRDPSTEKLGVVRHSTTELAVADGIPRSLDPLPGSLPQKAGDQSSLS